MEPNRKRLVVEIEDIWWDRLDELARQEGKHKRAIITDYIKKAWHAENMRRERAKEEA